MACNQQLGLLLKQFFREYEDFKKLRTLLESNDQQNERQALHMIEDGASVDFFDVINNETLLDVVIRVGTVSIIEIILQKPIDDFYLSDRYRSFFTKVMQSPKVVVLMRLFSKYHTIHVHQFSTDDLFQNVPDKNIAPVATTLFQIAYKQSNDNVLSVFEYILKRKPSLAVLLIECTNDTNEKLFTPQMMLSFPFVYRHRPSILATLIEAGADINKCVDSDSQLYALHLACNDEKALSLFLRLGADVNVTDKWNKTPFASLHLLSSHPSLDIAPHTPTWQFIKNFAYLNLRGYEVNNADMSLIRSHPKFRDFYLQCVEELNTMKAVQVTHGFSYHEIFTKSSYKLSMLLKNIDICKQIRISLRKSYVTCKFQNRSEQFPIYAADIRKHFGIAKHIRELLMLKERELEQLFEKNFPALIIRMIVNYACDIEQLEKEYVTKNFS